MRHFKIQALILITIFSISCRSKISNKSDISIEVYKVCNNTEIGNNFMKLVSEISKKSSNNLSKLSPNISFNQKSEIIFPSSAYIGFANNSDTLEINKQLVGNKLLQDNSIFIWLPAFQKNSEMSNLSISKQLNILFFDKNDIEKISFIPHKSSALTLLNAPQYPTEFNVEVRLNDNAIKSIQSFLGNNDILLFVCKINSRILHTEFIQSEDKLNSIQFLNSIDKNLKDSICLEFPNLCSK